MRHPLPSGVLGLVFALGLLGLSTPGPAQAADPPTLTILSPAMDALIGNGSPVVVIFAVSNFNLTPPGTGGPPDGNAGHVVVEVDGLRWTAVSASTIELPLPSGPHDIGLHLVATNGTPVSPAVRDRVHVVVTRGPAVGTPRIAITNPTPGAVRGVDLSVSFRLEKFALVPPGGPGGVPNEGHIHAILDGAFYAEITSYEPVHVGLGSGTHTILLQLVDGAHDPVTPGVVSVPVTFLVDPGVGRAPDFQPALAIANGALGLAILGVLLVRGRRRKR